MRLSTHKRWLQLLCWLTVPVLALLAAAVWLGWRLAQQLAQQQSEPLAGCSALAVPGLVLVLMLLVCLGVTWLWLRKVLQPWAALAQLTQERAPLDLRPVELQATDAPEVRSMVQALNRLLERQRASTDAQQRFVADAAHQLRTPLAALQSQVEAWALMARAAPEQSIVLPCEQVERLRHASRRTTQLANQLLALSRVDSGLKQGTAMERVDIKSLCEALVESFLDSAIAKEIDLGLEAEAAHVSGHEWLLREMLSNILDNAIKYSQYGGQVTLRCGRRHAEGGQSRVYVEVEDDGPGVPVGEYTRLTQRFYRVAGSTADGSGLGLAIVQEIAQAHAAQLSFSAGLAGRGLRVLLLFKE